jgi:hypothetical protein
MDESRHSPPISPDILYLFVLLVSLSVTAMSVLILLSALREGDNDQAWISVAYFAAASLAAAYFFWRLY